MAVEKGVTHIVDVEAGAAVPPEGHHLYARDTDKEYKSDGTTLTELATGGGSYTNEEAQDAVGSMIDTSLTYVDATPLLKVTALSGDVTSTGANVTTIANDAVTFAKMQNITKDYVIGRFSIGSGDPESVFIDPAGSVRISAGTIVRAALTGDVTAAQDSSSTTIANDAVTYAKIQNVTDARVLGRSAGSSGDAQEITIGNGLLLSGGELSNSMVSYRVLGVTFDGGDSTPTVGSVGYVVCPFDGVMDSWYIVGNSSGSAVVDVWKAAGSIPTNANTIAGTEKPTLSSQQLNSDTSITTWTTTAAVGDVYGFELESVTTCTRVTVEIRFVV